jgi:hypothetical protein
MNCQDISRIADSGRINALDDKERRAADEHVLACRSCAAVWGVQARLAMLPVPSMPAELRLRCRASAMLPAQTRTARGTRRLVLIGSVLGLAAAAGILLMSMQGTDAPAPASIAAATVTESAQAPAAPAEVAHDAAAVGTGAAAPIEALPAQRADLPLVPMPAGMNEHAMEDLALQKLVQRHPELVEGPDLEGRSYFQAAMAMRPDGDVLSSAVRIPSGSNAYELDYELYRTMPTDAGKTLISNPPKHTVVPDGRSLRANLNFRIVVVPAGYNAARSTNRVRELVGNRYNHLLLPSSGNVLNRLTILLAPDGTILKESVELERQEITRTPPRADDPKDVARVAEDMANRLGTDASEIGLMGSTFIDDGTIKLVDNGTPGGFVDDRRRQLMISYAWKRGSSESSPTLRQDGVTRPPVDLPSALAIVERQIPEAFTRKTTGTEGFMVILAQNGQFVRAGRIKMEGTPGMMADQLVPGVKVKQDSFTTVRLTNKTGATADVRFVWALPQPTADPQR